MWLSYRKDFKPLLIEKKEVQGQAIKNLTSDCNWGCTIRATQMLVANTLMRSDLKIKVEDILYL